MAGPRDPSTTDFNLTPKPQTGPVDNSDIPKNFNAFSPEVSNLLGDYYSNIDLKSNLGKNFFNDSTETINFNDARKLGSSFVRGASRNPAPPPRRTAASTIKEKLLKPALTSHFEAHFNPPRDVFTWMSGRGLNPTDTNNQRLITLSCSETALPGSRIATNTVQDDHHGVTERHAYRRQFDDTSSFTFYVDAPKAGADHGYKLIWFFEQWKSFIMNEEYVKSEDGVELDEYRWHYRAKFPKTYMTDIFITKFERDIDVNPINASKSTKKYLEYKFLQAYPISINTMPVSYDQSQLLKCTVSFAFSRYIVRRKTGISDGDPLPNRKSSFNEVPEFSAPPVLENQVGTAVPLEYRPILPGFGLGGTRTDNVA